MNTGQWPTDAESYFGLLRGTIFGNSFGNGPRISTPRPTPSKTRPITAVGLGKAIVYAERECDREGSMVDETLQRALPRDTPSYHERQAAHYRALAETATTPAIKARLLREAEEHDLVAARIAGES